MPSDTSKYISDEYITLDQILRQFNSDISKHIKSRQIPLIRDLQRRGASNSEIAQLLGFTHKKSLDNVLRKNHATK